MAGVAAAQTAGVRGTENPNAFPGSPSAAPLVSPERISPPRLVASPTDADEAAPPATAQPGEDRGAPNYGRPRKIRGKLYRPNPKTSVPLAPLVPYRGAPGPQRRALNPKPALKGTIDAVEPPPTIAVIASPERLKPGLAELEPFRQVGVNVGPLRLLPFVEFTTGYETNPNQVSFGVKPSAVLRASGGFDLASDFSRHSLTASLRAGYSDFPTNSQANRPDASGVVDGRIDVTRNNVIDLEGRFVVATQTPGSPLLAVPNAAFVTNRPVITSEGATVGFTHTFNRLAVGLRGTFDRTQYGNGTNSDGTIVAYSQDNYNDYGVVARASYELSPALIPFAEVGFDSRVRDNAVDLSGFLRDSTGVVARAGSTFDLFGHFTGTLSAGYADRHYQDRRLPNLNGPTVNGSLAYAATPLTVFTFRAVTTLAETTLPGASGAISRQISLEVSHLFSRNFAASAIATYQPNQYQGVSVQETFTQFTLKSTYSLSREIQLIGSASRQTLQSSLANYGFTDYIFLAGVRLQR